MKQKIEIWVEKLQLLKSDKRRYRIAITLLCFMSAIILEFVFFTFSAMVENTHNGFYYFFKGIYFLLIESRKETNACQGFVFIGVVLGYIPSIICVIILYFDITHILIYEKLASIDFFKDKSYAKVKSYLRIGHIFALAILFLSVCSLIIIASGNSAKIQNAIFLIEGFISDSLKERFLAAITFVYYSIGFMCAAIFLIWLISFIVYWTFKYIIKGLSIMFKSIGSVFKRKK